MNPQSRDTVTFLLTTLVSMSVLAGLAVRFILMPYLRDHLIEPVQQTHKQVTENHHRNQEQPTLPDRLEDVRTDIAAVRVDVGALARVMDTHMEWSERHSTHTDRKIRHLRRIVKRHHPDGTETTHETHPTP